MQGRPGIVLTPQRGTPEETLPKVGSTRSSEDPVLRGVIKLPSQ
jgi:hypothetical protein